MDDRQIGCIGITVSFASSVVAGAIAVVGILVSLQANNTATTANQIAESSILRANENAAADRQQQADIARFEQNVKRPSLTALRFDRISDTEFRATIQNTGERQAAVFDLEYVFQDVKGAGPPSSKTVAVIPTENLAKTINVEFVDGKSTKHAFQHVVVMPAGEVVVFRIKSSASMRTGEFVLHFGEGEKLSLGLFTLAPIEVHQPIEDLFGTPTPPNTF